MQRKQFDISSASPLNCGVPQGLAIIGLLFFLIHINDLPNCLSLSSPRMYADDTNITFAAFNVIGLETQINDELKSINLWLRGNKLSLKRNDKTININVDVVKINQTNHSKVLELKIDENLSWKEHIHARKEGRKGGREEGSEEGRKDGGRNEGKKEGRKEGRKEGKKEGTNE